jgi:hypothetical protein
MLLEEKENHIGFLQGELEVSVGKVGGVEVRLGEVSEFLGKERIHNEEKTKTITRLVKGNRGLEEV